MAQLPCRTNNLLSDRTLESVSLSRQHVYPWDYKVSELPKYYCNFTIPFIDLFAWLGWATDLKTVSTEMIRKRVMRTGDGSHRYAGGQVDASSMRDVDHFWGFGELLIVKRNYFWKQLRAVWRFYLKIFILWSQIDVEEFKNITWTTSNSMFLGLKVCNNQIPRWIPLLHKVSRNNSEKIQLKPT